MTGDGTLILAAGLLLAAGVVVSFVAGRFRLPALVIFLGLGMAIGSDGTGWIHFGDYEQARLIGTIALAAILFEAGLAAGYREIKPVLRTGLSLAFVGTAATAAVTGLAASWLFGFGTLEGLLLGAILAATDGAAVFSLLRGSKLRKRLARTLEAEAGLNDPVAVLLVLGLISALTTTGYGVADFAALLASELAIGAAIGLAAGGLAVVALRRGSAIPPGLQLVTSLAALAIAYGGAAALHGSGFLAAYLAGLTLGSVKLPATRPIVSFHEGIVQVAEIALFFTLGLLVFPDGLGDVLVEGTLLALVIAFVARPLAAWLATAFGGYAPRERLLLGWAGLRGGVPVVLATLPVIDGVSGSREFFDIAFFAVLVSTLVQGVTLEPLARRLGLTEEGDSVDGVEPEVSPEEARSAAQEGARLIDVRRDEEWAAGRIGGAEHVRLDQVQQRAAELTDRPVVFYCQTGERSGMAAQAFRGAGQEAASLAGGLAAWEAAGLPVET